MFIPDWVLIGGLFGFITFVLHVEKDIKHLDKEIQTIKEEIYSFKGDDIDAIP